MSLLILFDLSGMVHRAFHGQPHNAGRLAMDWAERTVTAWKADAACAAVDRPFPTFRHDLAPGVYKATGRVEGPERAAVMEQLRIAEGLFEDVLGMRVVGARGFEADDVVATLADMAVWCEDDDGNPADVLIAAKDKDFCQLVRRGCPKGRLVSSADEDDEDVIGKYVQLDPDECSFWVEDRLPTDRWHSPIGDRVFADLGARGGISMLDIATGAVSGPEDVFAKYGVHPLQFADYLAIVGDKSDNVPGVFGCGPVAARELLAEFLTLSKALDSAELGRGDDGHAYWKENSKVWSRIAGSRDVAELARKLVTLRRDVPISDGLGGVVTPENLFEVMGMPQAVDA